MLVSSLGTRTCTMSKPRVASKHRYARSNSNSEGLILWLPLEQATGSWLIWQLIQIIQKVCRSSRQAEQLQAQAAQCCAVLNCSSCRSARLVTPAHLIAQEQAVHVFNGGNQSINVSLLLSDLSKAATTAIEISRKAKHRHKAPGHSSRQNPCIESLWERITAGYYFRQLPYLIKDIDQVAHVLKIVNLPVELEGSVTAVAAQQQRFLKVLGPAERLSNSTTTYEHTKSD